MSVTDSTTSVVSTATQGGVAMLCATFLNEALSEMIPYMFVALFLILADLYFGVSVSVKKGKEVRLSRMIRRTVGKGFEYLCWITVSSSLSVAFDFHALQYIIFGVVAGNEVLSILTNWSILHDKKVTIDWVKILGKKVGMEDLSENVKIEEIEDEDK